MARDADAERVNKLKALKPGQSIFVKDGTQNSVQKLRRLASEAGIPINIYTIENDSMHKCAGVRIFRSQS